MAKNNKELANIEEILSKTVIEPKDLKAQMEECFLSYAMAVNRSRAIPDVRDGLKPVHRRILYAMYDMGNTYDKPTKKCARIVGEVLGKYHPHGDSSVYDALVRLAQWFSINEPLVDGQGNFGTVDGDPAAAQRYTEARLSKIANEMLRDIDKDTVNMQNNFDDTLEEPTVLPAKFPNLLVNGSEGIAVGMATSIPPHNLREVIDGTVALLDNPEITVDEIMEYIPAPDYPTGGLVLGHDAIQQAYRTGHGGVIIRARAEIEEDEETGRASIVVTQLPYQVNKALLIKNIADQVRDKKIEGISDIHEESDRFGMRIVIDVKREASAMVVLNTLYKQTNMQVSTGINFLAIYKGKPVVMNLKEILNAYLEHQINVITRRTQFDLTKAQEREHIVKGLIIAINNIDRVVEVIKNSRERQVALENLMAEFALTEKQANAILDMRLSSLTGLQVEKLQEEEKQLIETIADLQDILAKPERVRAIIKDELVKIKDTYGVDRKSEISYEAGDINLEDLITREDVVISMTREGFIKRQSVSEYKAQNRGGMGVAAHKTREEDVIKKMFVCHSHDDLMFFSNKGKAYKLRAYNVPEAVKNSKGRAMINFLQLTEGEKITAFLPITDYTQGYIVMATKKGLIRKSDTMDFESVRQNGKLAITLLEGDELAEVELTSGNDDILIASHKGKCIRFNENDVRRTGRGSQGVKSIELSDDDYMVDMSIIKPGDTLITISEKGFGKRVDETEFRTQGRGGKGIKAGNFTNATGLLVNMKPVKEDQDIILIADNGTMMRTRAEQISKIGRATKGVTIMRLKGSAKVVALAVVDHDENAEMDDVVIDENEIKEAQQESQNSND